MNSIESISFLLTFLLGGTIVLGLFMVLLLIRSSMGPAKWLLSVALMGLIGHLLTFLLFTTQLIRQWPHALGITFPLLFLIGPCFYFFVRSYAQPKFAWNWKHALHALPFAAFLWYQFSSTYLATTARKLELVGYYYKMVPEGHLTWEEWAFFNLHILLILAYAGVAWQFLSNKQLFNRAILKRFTGVLIGLSLIYLVVQSGFLWSGAALITSEVVLSAILAMAVLLMGFWLMDVRQFLPLEKYQTASLPQHQAQNIESALTKALEEQELFLNPHLKMAQLAEAVQVPSHHLSQVMSSQMNTNFYQLINHYRVERSKNLLKSKRIEQVSIHAIGLDCGFSNKTSFYRAFKKSTGMTPTEFMGK